MKFKCVSLLMGNVLAQVMAINGQRLSEQKTFTLSLRIFAQVIERLTGKRPRYYLAATGVSETDLKLVGDQFSFTAFTVSLTLPGVGISKVPFNFVVWNLA